MFGKAHYVKSWPEYFQAILEGRKSWEIRNNDRDYKIGDIIYFLEYDKFKDKFSGKVVSCIVQFVWINIPGLSNNYHREVEYVVLDLGPPQNPYIVTSDRGLEKMKNLTNVE